ncbi:hypothetical protein [Methylotenera sp. N17]|uniref:hypothetical protein n=1 Tax=Methylotenera sp. N17 TaxID=1502761 RepID=UPI00068A75AE|nr:hypothetical protein [Methylotenera sp. N17]
MSGDQFNNANYWRNQSSTEADKLQREKEKNRKENEARAEQQQRDQFQATNNLHYLNHKISEQEKEIEYYKSLLTKPMREIAEKNQEFLETYHEQQTILGSWVLNQRAYKEIAIKLGLQNGLTKEEVIEEADKIKEKVINNQTEYDNNFNQNDWETFYAPRIREKMGIK